MKHITLGPWQEQPYGVSATGRAEYADHGVPITVYSPHERIDDEYLPWLINFNGLTAGARSMEVPARTAAALGYAAVTFDYTNTGSKNTLRHNADDGLVVAESLGADSVELLGLSMGGAVATKAAATIDQPLDALHLVAPGTYIHGVAELPPCEVQRAFRDQAIEEIADFWKNPMLASIVAIDSLQNCLRRPRAVAGELSELLRDTAYTDLHHLRMHQPEAWVSLTHGSHDKLVPRAELLAAIQQEDRNERPLIDADFPYRGGHTAVTRDHRLTERILTAERPATAHVPTAA